MHLVRSYALFPGCCNLCRGSKDPAIDLLTTNQYEERQYVCLKCVASLGNFAGWVSGAAADALRAQIEDQRAENEALSEKVAELDEMERWVALSLAFGVRINKQGKVLGLRKQQGAH